MNHLGDYDLSAVIYGMFNTFDPATGALVTLSGSGASLVAFKNNGSGESAAGITLTIDFDGRTGCHAFEIDTSADGAFYSAGGAFSVIVNGGMAGAVSLAGAVVASFSLRKDSSLKPTTAGRALDVTATGAAGIDWGNVENPTTALNLSGTNIDPDQVVASVTGNVGGSVASVGADGITSSSMAASAVAEIQSGLATDAALATTDGKVDALGVLVLDLPTNAEFNARTLAAASYATAASQTTIEGKVDTVDTVVDGIAAKTVQLEFTGGGVEANIVAVIGDPVQENGSTATNWGGTP